MRNFQETFEIVCTFVPLNTLAKIHSARGTSHHLTLKTTTQPKVICLSPIYQVNGSLQCCRWCVEASMKCCSHERVGEKLNLKYVIITIIRKSFDNDNNSMIIMIIKLICSRWYIHKVWYKVNKRRQYSNTRYNKQSEHWSRKNAQANWPRKTSNVD